MSSPKEAIATAGKIDFAIIGVQKSATTTVHEVLASHPSIMMLDGEKSCFESPDFERGSYYVQLSPLIEKGTRLAGIKRPTMLHEYPAVHRLKEHSPKCKLIVVLRDPVDRFVSAYFHTMNYSKIPVMDINKAVRQMFLGSYLDEFPVGQGLLRYGLYNDFLTDLDNRYEHGDMIVLAQKKMKCDFIKMMQNITRFLGVDSIHTENSANVSFNSGIYSYTNARLNRFSNFFDYSYTASRTRLTRRKNGILHSFGKAARLVARKIPKKSIDPKHILSEESRELLERYYACDKQTLLQGRFSTLVYW